MLEEDILRDQCGLDPARPVVAGVSGGPDSLCLLDVLHRAGYRLVVAHFDHRLRPGSDRESAAVGALARSLGLDFVPGSADVGAYAAAQRLSVEEAARALRYRFLFETARTCGAQAVAVGHTADDQAETVLMHFLRGAGLPGLKGMPWRTVLPAFDAHIPLVRPLLRLWRADTEAWCLARSLQPVYDPTNADTTYFRNRLRHELVPILERYNPRVKDALVRSAEALQGDFALLAELLESTWGRAVREQGEGYVAFDRSALTAMSIPLRRGLFRRAAFTLRPGLRDLGFAALGRAATLRPVDLSGGLRLFVEDKVIYLAAYETDLPCADYPQTEEQLAIGGQQVNLGNDWLLTIEYPSLFPDLYSLFTDNWTVHLDADQLSGPLLVRPRRDGDRVQPLGMAAGSVKLQDFFVNAKLPRRARRQWPLLCAGETIAWVPGYCPAHPFRITAKTRRIVKIVVRKT